MKRPGSSRIALALCFFALWASAISARLYQLQVIDHGEYVKRAERQQQRVFELDPPRGTIYDARGRELAVSVEVESLAAVPREIDDPAQTARALARLLDLDVVKLSKQLAQDREFVWVARKLDPPVAARVRALELKGLRFLPESKRYYPLRSLAASVLGYVGTDNKGLAGLEAEFDSLIAGKPGRRTVLRDARRGTALAPDLAYSEAEPGSDLHLTLDSTLQHVVERELEATVRRFRAKSGSAVFIDPKSGAILAMATAPSFDANDFRSFHEDERRNRPIMDAYEPGSTFKMITAVAALEANSMDPADVLDCQMGSIQLLGVRINDHKPFGLLSMREVIAHSSNVGAIKIGLAAGQTQLDRTLRQFGFGEPTGVDLPGESPGIVRAVERWAPVSKAYISFGQGLSVTALQLANAFAAAGNGGKLYRPYIVASGPAGNRRPVVIRAVASPASLRSIDRMLEAVVIEGTGKAANAPGFTVAGKTGTAQKAMPGGYSPDKFIASFAGYAPARDPVIAGVVVIDEPRGGQYHGGDVAAPVFGAVAREALLAFGVATSRETPEAWPYEHRAKDDPAATATAEVVATAPAAPAAPVAVAHGPLVPDWVGRSARSAYHSARDLGLKPLLRGHGFVVAQQPPAGSPLVAGQVLVLDLALERSADVAGGAGR